MWLLQGDASLLNITFFFFKNLLIPNILMVLCIPPLEVEKKRVTLYNKVSFINIS